MVHDGERGEANTCDPSSHLMSPVLGPGKVTWSPCSDQELASFLTGPDTKIQVYRNNVFKLDIAFLEIHKEYI